MECEQRYVSDLCSFIDGSHIHSRVHIDDHLQYRHCVWKSGQYCLVSMLQTNAVQHVWIEVKWSYACYHKGLETARATMSVLQRLSSIAIFEVKTNLICCRCILSVLLSGEGKSHRY